MGEKISKEHLAEYYDWPGKNFSVECMIPFVIDNKSILLIGDYRKNQRTEPPEEFDDEIIIDGGAGIENLDLRNIQQNYKLKQINSGLLTIRTTSNTFMPLVFKIDSEMLRKTNCSNLVNGDRLPDLSSPLESKPGYIEFCADCPTRLSALEALDHYLYKYPKRNKTLNYKHKFIVAKEYFIKTLADGYLDLPLKKLNLSLQTSRFFAENNLCLVEDVLAFNDQELRNLKDFSEESFKEWKGKIIDLILRTESEAKENL